MDSQQSIQQRKPVLQVKDLSMAYGASKVVSDINLHVMEGEIFGLIGVSGSGKTTLLELFIGFLEPTDGDVRYRASLLDPSRQEEYRSIVDDRESARRLFGFA